MKPIRIQRRRTKGWRMPPNTVSVTRPGIFGNPFSVDYWGLELSLKLFSEIAHGGWNPSLIDGVSDERYHEAYELYRVWTRRIGGHPAAMIRTYLRGKDLACWCPVPKTGEPDQCHASILLEIANRL